MLCILPKKKQGWKKRLDVLDLAVQKLKENVAIIKECGPKVIMERAKRGGVRMENRIDMLGDLETMTMLGIT